MKRTPIPRKRASPRRGQLTAAEKQAIRIAVRERAHGICEAQAHKQCWKARILPLGGPDPWSHGHVAHGRAKALYGWAESQQQWLTWLCPPCHLGSEHTEGRKMPRPDRPILVVKGAHDA